MFSVLKIEKCIRVVLLLTLGSYAQGELVKEPIDIQSVRNTLGAYNVMEHAHGQMRAGYITLSQEGTVDSSAYALGGHYHFYTKRWNGLSMGSELYTVLNPGVNQNSLYLNGDFFDARGKSFILLSQIYIDGQWGNTEIKLGRQVLNTPHADSDDIRMIPNYFEAYTLRNTDVDDLTLCVGLIRKMAGWENGVDSSEFVEVGKTLGTQQKTEGIYYAWASYDGIKDLSLSLWYYHYNDIANVIYAEAGYAYVLSNHVSMQLGFQYDSSEETGRGVLGNQDAQTYGISLETNFRDIGLTLLAAYNQDNGDMGAMGLSLGGGPFFTSMEDQTLDALGTAGDAWIVGLGYDFEKLGVGGLTFGMAYGSFSAKEALVYEAREIDAVLEYSFGDKITATVALASVDFRVPGMEDYDQVRVVATYTF